MVFMTLLFAVVFLAGPAKTWWGVMQIEGDPAPAFSLKPVRGGTDQMILSDFKGKVVLIDFWTTWCPPCRKQMPALQRVHTDPKYKGKVVVLSVNADEPAPKLDRKVQLYLNHFALTMPAAFADAAILKAYRVNAFPTLVLIDANGKVAHFMRGGHAEKDLRAKIDSILPSS